MPPTLDFRETIMERAIRDKEYRKGMLTEAVNEILEGNLDVGKAMLALSVPHQVFYPGEGPSVSIAS